MLKKFLLGLIVAGSIFGLFAVYQSDKQNEGKTVIQYASWGSKSEVDILKPLLVDFEMENRTPLNCRENPKFSKYFNLMWKELGNKTI